MNSSVLKGLLAATLLMAGASTAQAQISFGPRVGLNYTKFNLDLEGNNLFIKSRSRYGAQVGLAMNAQFGNLAVQPAVLFTMKGGKTQVKRNGSSTFGSTTINYVEIPVNLVYSTSGAEGGFQVFAGPYVGLGVGGKYYSTTMFTNGFVFAFESREGDVKFASKEGKERDKEYIRNIDAGLNLGMGYKVGGIQAQLGYGLGLSNIIPNDQDDKKPEDKVHNRGFQLSLTYFIQE